MKRESGLRGIWKEGFWDTQLRYHESYGATWNYVQQNPLRDGLAQDESDCPYQGEVEILEWHARLEGSRPRPSRKLARLVGCACGKLPK